MKKTLTILFAAMNFVCFSQLAVYDFEGNELAASASETGVTAADATHTGLGSTGSFFSCSGDAWSPNSWNQTEMIDLADNFAEYTITADAGNELSVTGFTFSARRSNSGPDKYSIRTSDDAYAADALTGTTGTSCGGEGGAFAAPITVAAGASLTIRIYGYSATSSGGNMRMDDVTILGTVTVLPVELVGFNASLQSDKTVALSWATASEENNAYFNIERSLDGERYETLGTVEGAGNSTEILNYDFTDNTPADLNYYRLKQVDFDGTSSYSDVAVVRISKESEVFTIFPNPVKGNLNIDMGTFAGEATFNVVDLSGKTIISQVNTVEGVQSINTESLSVGVYFVQIITATEQSSIKFTKK